MFLAHTPPRKRDTKAAFQMAADVAPSKTGRDVDDIPDRHVSPTHPTPQPQSETHLLTSDSYIAPEVRSRHDAKAVGFWAGPTTGASRVRCCLSMWENNLGNKKQLFVTGCLQFAYT